MTVYNCPDNIDFSFFFNLQYLCQIAQSFIYFFTSSVYVTFYVLCFSDTTDAVDDDILSEDHPSAPQLMAPTEGRDLLTCGQCSQAFPLAHILAFIQHKQGGCQSKNQALNVIHTPRSPANRAQERVSNSDPGPGFIELRRGTARNQAWGEEPGVRLKVEPRRTGEHLKKKQRAAC